MDNRQKAIDKIIRRVELMANCTVQDRRWKLMKEIIQALAALESEPDKNLHPNKNGREDCADCPFPDRKCSECINRVQPLPNKDEPVEPSEFTKDNITAIMLRSDAEKLPETNELTKPLLLKAAKTIDRQAATIKSQAAELKNLKECKAEPRPNPVE